jgi:hypothetical protein
MINAILQCINTLPNKRVGLTFEQNGPELIVTIRDEVHAFIPDEVPRPAGAGKFVADIGPWHILTEGIHR